MSNMGGEMGAKFAMFRADEKTLGYLSTRSDQALETFDADEDAAYAFKADIDVSEIVAQVAKPPSPGNAVSIEAVAGTPVDRIFLGSCTNARLEDLAIAAKMLKGRTIAPSTRMLITPASKQTILAATKAGTWRRSWKPRPLQPLPVVVPAPGVATVCWERGKLPIHDQQKFQRSHGQSRCVHLSGVTRDRRCLGDHWQHHRPAGVLAGNQPRPLTTQRFAVDDGRPSLREVTGSTLRDGFQDGAGPG